MTVIHGIDANNNVIPLLLDSNGRVLLSQETPSTSLPTAQYTRLDNTTLAAGTNILEIVTVPTGQKWILDAITVRYTGTVTNVIMRPYIEVSAVRQIMISYQGLTSGADYNLSPGLVVEAGYKIGCVITSVTLNDDFTGIVFARRIL